MALSNAVVNGVLHEHEAKSKYNDLDTASVVMANEVKLEIVWQKVLKFTVLHLAALYGAYLFFTSAKWQTNSFVFLLYILSTLGITAGAHRLWSHRTYKAKWPLRLILGIFNTLAFQYPIITWARDHRLHHKYSETDADPHNPARGLLFSHIGWLMVRRHPEVLRKGKEIDLSDLYADTIVTFQKKYYMSLVLLVCFIIPTLIPVYFWSESWITALYVAGFFRHATQLNVTLLVNSAAHKWGNKPYDKLMVGTENVPFNILSLGEGYHNYHHTFPWDYKTSELNIGFVNSTTHFINFFNKIGWAYDLKTVSEDIIRKRVERTGDGSHAL